MKLVKAKEGTVISVFVKPKQAKYSIAIDGDDILIFSTEEPVKGRVNKEILKVLSKLFKSEVEIISGSTSRQKQILIRNLEKNEVERLLRNIP